MPRVLCEEWSGERNQAMLRFMTRGGVSFSAKMGEGSKKSEFLCASKEFLCRSVGPGVFDSWLWGNASLIPGGKRKKNGSVCHRVTITPVWRNAPLRRGMSKPGVWSRKTKPFHYESKGSPQAYLVQSKHGDFSMPYFRGQGLNKESLFAWSGKAALSQNWRGKTSCRGEIIGSHKEGTGSWKNVSAKCRKKERKMTAKHQDQ